MSDVFPVPGGPLMRTAPSPSLRFRISTIVAMRSVVTGSVKSSPSSGRGSSRWAVTVSPVDDSISSSRTALAILGLATSRRQRVS